MQVWDSSHNTSSLSWEPLETGKALLQNPVLDFPTLLMPVVFSEFIF